MTTRWYLTAAVLLALCAIVHADAQLSVSDAETEVTLKDYFAAKAEMDAAEAAMRRGDHVEALGRFSAAALVIPEAYEQMARIHNEGLAGEPDPEAGKKAMKQGEESGGVQGEVDLLKVLIDQEVDGGGNPLEGDLMLLYNRMWGISQKHENADSLIIAGMWLLYEADRRKQGMGLLKLAYEKHGRTEGITAVARELYKTSGGNLNSKTSYDAAKLYENACHAEAPTLEACQHLIHYHLYVKVDYELCAKAAHICASFGDEDCARIAAECDAKHEEYLVEKAERRRRNAEAKAAYLKEMAEAEAAEAAEAAQE